MNEIEIDWNDIIRNHSYMEGTSRVELTILDINAAKREIKVLSKKNGQMKVEICRLCVDEIGFLYFCYPHIYSEEIYIQESYL